MTTDAAVSMGSSRYVGRRRELAALALALTRPPAVVLVEGEAGIGKTRLLAEALAGRDHALVAGCPPGRQRYTLGPVVEAVRPHGLPTMSGLAGVLRPLLPEWSPALPPTPEPPDDPQAARHQLFRALADVLAGLEVVDLVIEDVHWADEATLEFLLFLTSRQPQPVNLVLTYRPEDLPPDSLLLRLSSRAAPLRLTLGPLDVAETAAVVSSMLHDEPLSDAFAAFMHEHTDGVPLAVEETVRLLHDRADLRRQDGRWMRHQLADLQVPPTIRDAVLERARRLTAPAREVLDAAAILDAPANDAALSAMTGLSEDELCAGLTEALSCALLADERRGVAFRHNLAARALYEAIPAPRRRALHLRAGRYLETLTQPPVTRLTRHFRDADDQGSWRRYAEEAAETAAGAGDEATAADLLHDLLTNADLPPAAVLEVMQRLSLPSLSGRERISDLAQVLRTALSASQLRREQAAPLRFHLGVMLDIMGEHDASRTELELAVPDLEAGSVESVQAMLLLGWGRGTAMTRAQHLRWLHCAARAIPALPSSEGLDLTHRLATGLLFLGEEEGWAATARVPDDTATAVQRSNVLRRDMNVGDLAMRWGRYPEARTRLERALDLARRQQYARLGCTIHSTLIQLDWFTGRWSGLAERAEALAAQLEVQPGDLLESTFVSGLLAAARGADADAEQVFQRLLAEGRQAGAVFFLMAPAGALARLYLSQGRNEEALRATEEPAAILLHKDVWLWATELAPARVEALIATDRLADAASITAAYERGLAGRAAPAPHAGLAVCRALLAQAAEPASRASDLFAAAATAWEQLPRPYEMLLAREQQGICLLAAGMKDPAVRLLTQVRRGLSELGAPRGAERVALLLREHGAAPPAEPWRGGRRGYGTRLSPRELEVVRLVIAGHTNPEIARALHRSPKTVANQLNSAMRKLNVSTRTALAVSAIGLGAINDPAD